MRKLSFCNPRGGSHYGDSGRARKAFRERLDRCLVLVDDHAIERPAPFHHHKSQPAHNTKPVGRRQRSRRLQLRHLPWCSVMHLDPKELPFSERVDVEMTVTAESNAVETSALA